MFVLGIDPGLTTTGYGLLRSRPRPQAVAVGVIRTDPAAPVAERLRELYRDLTSVIVEHRPDRMAIEEVFVNLNRQTAAAVGRAAGVVILAAAQAGLPVHEYTPTAVKSAVAGYGGADKRQVRAMVARRLGLAVLPGPSDAADALAVAVCHAWGGGLRDAVAAAVVKEERSGGVLG
ncbi:MAG: crossover junction endodeoxyribonuclease RuvC [Acidimicrobiia bacterium]